MIIEHKNVLVYIYLLYFTSSFIYLSTHIARVELGLCTKPHIGIVNLVQHLGVNKC